MQRNEATDLFIQHFSFWKELTEAQKTELCEHTGPMHYKKGPDRKSVV